MKTAANTEHMSPQTNDVWVAWWVPDRLPPLISGANYNFMVIHNDLSDCPDADIAVIDGRMIDDSPPLLRSLREMSIPALVLCTADGLDKVIERLPCRHDLGMIGLPDQLIAHRLNRMADHRDVFRDPLTGLSNRQRFFSLLKRWLNQASNANPISAILLNVDRLKAVNDTYGHEVGDLVLSRVAQRISEAAPSRSLIGRVGGEEFVVVVNADEYSATKLAESIRSQLTEQPLSTTVSTAITASAGIMTTHKEVRRRVLMQNAEEAMYAAKARGRNQAIHYSALIRQSAAYDGDVAMQSFENMTRVMSDRVVDTIARRSRRIFKQIQQQADIDELTGLFNRRYLNRRLQHEYRRAESTSSPLSVIMIDVDHFGQVNKTYGWPTGDIVLQEVASVLRNTVRAQDWLARYGGEEFCVVMPQSDLAAASLVMERIQKAMECHPFVIDSNQTIRVTVSLGAAEKTARERNVMVMMNRVSERLLHSKQQGRNQWSM